MHPIYNVKKSNELLDRVMNLPNRIIDDEDFPHSKSSTESKQETERKYEQKKSDLLYTVDQLMLDTRGFIKIVYGTDSEYFRWLHKIGFTSETKGFIINTYNINHNTYWQEGKRELASLLSNIISEEKAKAERESFIKDGGSYFKLCIFMVVFVIAIITVWQLPESLFLEIIAADKIVQSKAILSICIGCLSLIIVKPESWKELFAAFVAAALIFIPLLK
jgi:hypothetical protein